jgi:hypothetical protein
MSNHDRRWYAALILFAVAVRVAAVFAVGSYRLERVTYEHGEIARNLVSGRGFVVEWMGVEGPTSQQAPVYPGLVAVFYWLFGADTPVALLGLQLFQALLGGGLVAGAAGLGWTLMPDRRTVGWLAGMGAAVYPTLVYAATQVQVASLAATLVVFVIWTAHVAASTSRHPAALACGLASGTLVLTDPILSLVVVVALVVVGVEGSTFRARVRQVCIAATVTVAVVFPWIVRNYRVHGEVVFVKSTFGYAFWQGNHPRSFGTDKIPALASRVAAPTGRRSLRSVERSLWQQRLNQTVYIDDAVLTPERRRELGLLSETARSRELLAESLENIRRQPLHYARLCAQRLWYFLLFDPTNPKSRVFIYRAAQLVLAASAVAGLCLTRGHWHRLWPTFFVVAAVTLFHTLTIVSARFHIPLEPILILWTSAAATKVPQWLRAYGLSNGSLPGPRGLVLPCPPTFS